MRTPLSKVLHAVALLAAASAAARLEAGPVLSRKNLGDLSLEELMNETVTSVSKKEQKLGDAAAAISVVSNEDIRRSGATNLPDALRLVPGMDVASINSSQSAVSVRGSNSAYANKLLVLVDGRAVYTPLFAGVLWDMQQVMLEDLDRIEVIRGPGATLWGANAVNGVINVVTRSARDTPGGMIYAGGGSFPDLMGGVRYGGKFGEHTYYRVYASGQKQDDFPLANGQPAGDNWTNQHGGVRVDHYPDDAAHFTWQAEATTTDLDHHTADARNLNTLARWSRSWSDGSALEVQAYVDHLDRNEPARAAVRVDTYDFSLQHSFGLGGRNDAIWGIGYRYIAGGVTPTGPAIIVRRPHFSEQLASAFLQDEIKLVPDKFSLTLGAKIEHNVYTGVEIQPNFRLMFKPADNQTFWAAISRAVRTPSVLEGRDVVVPLYGTPFVGPGGGIYLPALVGNSDLASEKLWAYELGWRMQPSARVSVDLAMFYNDYRSLTTPSVVPQFVPAVPFGLAELPWTNELSAKTYGGEGTVVFSPTNAWRMTAAYSVLVAHFEGQDLSAQSFDSASPRYTGSLRSAYEFNSRLSLDGQFRYVGAIEGVPAYHTIDLRLSYRPNDQLEFSFVGQNLLDDRHPEQSVAPLFVLAEVPRSFYAKIRWRF